MDKQEKIRATKLAAAFYATGQEAEFSDEFMVFNNIDGEQAEKILLGLMDNNMLPKDARGVTKIPESVSYGTDVWTHQGWYTPEKKEPPHIQYTAPGRGDERPLDVMYDAENKRLGIRATVINTTPLFDVFLYDDHRLNGGYRSDVIKEVRPQVCRAMVACCDTPESKKRLRDIFSEADALNDRRIYDHDAYPVHAEDRYTRFEPSVDAYAVSKQSILDFLAKMDSSLARVQGALTEGKVSRVLDAKTIDVGVGFFLGNLKCQVS